MIAFACGGLVLLSIWLAWLTHEVYSLIRRFENELLDLRIRAGKLEIHSAEQERRISEIETKIRSLRG